MKKSFKKITALSAAAVMMMTSYASAKTLVYQDFNTDGTKAQYGWGSQVWDSDWSDKYPAAKDGMFSVDSNNAWHTSIIDKRFDISSVDPNVDKYLVIEYTMNSYYKDENGNKTMYPLANDFITLQNCDYSSDAEVTTTLFTLGLSLSDIGYGATTYKFYTKDKDGNKVGGADNQVFGFWEGTGAGSPSEPNENRLYSPNDRKYRMIINTSDYSYDFQLSNYDNTAWTSIVNGIDSEKTKNMKNSTIGGYKLLADKLPNKITLANQIMTDRNYIDIDDFKIYTLRDNEELSKPEIFDVYGNKLETIPAGGKFNMCSSFNNTTSSPKNLSMIMAAYDRDEYFTDYSEQQAVIAAADTGVAAAAFTAPTDAAKVGLYTWSDLENMIPYSIGTEAAITADAE